MEFKINLEQFLKVFVLLIILKNNIINQENFLEEVNIIKYLKILYLIYW